MKNKAIVPFQGGQTQNLSAVKKHAFTLAEVLITLGIIGVVAAMTLPALVQNYNKKILETAFKKSVNTVLNTNKMLLAQKEQFSLCDLEYFECNEGESDMDVVNEYLDDYMKAFGFTKTRADLGALMNGTSEVYLSKDGACYRVVDDSTWVVSQPDRHTLAMFVDTNCEKRPNQGGRDQFFIFITDRGDLYEWGNVDGAVDAEETCKAVMKEAKNQEEFAFAAIYCSPYLIMNSYNMDY